MSARPHGAETVHGIDVRALLADAPGFLSVVEHGSFASAGRRLGVSPSVLSRQVSRLERTLGLRLLERNTRGLRVTDDGSSVRRRLQEVFALTEELAGFAESSATVATGTVRVGATPDLAGRLLEPLMADLLDALPHVNLQLVVSDEHLDPVAHGLDLVLSVTGSPVEGLVARRLRRVRHVLCAAPEYLERFGTPRSPEDLRAHECIRRGPEAHDSSWRLVSATAEARVAIEGRYGVDHAGMRLRAALAGRGIACVPDFVAEPAFASGRAVRVLARWWGSGDEHVQLQYPSTRLLPRRTRAVIDRLRAALEEPAGRPGGPWASLPPDEGCAAGRGRVRPAPEHLDEPVRPTHHSA